jgi:hypothetical protein
MLGPRSASVAEPSLGTDPQRRVLVAFADNIADIFQVVATMVVCR